MSLPTIAIPGPQIDARQHIEPGTSSTVIVAYIIGVVAALGAILATYGVALIFFIFSPFINWHLRRKAMAMIHGSGLKVTEANFPEIHACVRQFSERLGVTQPPDVYIVNEETANAAAVRLGKRQVVLLTDEVVHGAIYAEAPQALAFVIGHELAHVALAHNSGFRSYVAGVYKKLSRLDEFTADRVASALCGKKEVALMGLLLITVGHQLVRHINLAAVQEQARQVAGDKYTAKAEKALSHPLLMNRISRFI